MRWKHKYIVGMTVMSMFFTLPLVSAEDDDVVVYGEDFEPETETVANNENTSVIETPEEQTNGSEYNPTNTEETQSTSPENTLIENVIPPEVQETVEEIKPAVEVEDLNSTEDYGSDSNDGDDESYNDNPPAETPETPIEEIKPEFEVEDLSTNESENYNNNSSVETPMEETQTETPVEELTPEIENERLSTDTPIVEENFGAEETFPTSENFSSDETLSTGETEVPIEEMTTNFGSESDNRELGGNEYTTNTNTTVASDGTTGSPNNVTTEKSSKTEKEKKLKTQKARFVKLLSDETYEYYLDRSAVRWINMPYSTSEYMADVWIRMIEKNDRNSDDLYQYLSSGDGEIADAAEKGLAYTEVDKKVLRSKKYFLEHYYIRPKTRQIQFLCELEVIGRPQNAISERPYEYKNWENLIPGSVESYIYSGVLSEIGTSKANKRGHMTFVDMLDEYARIALN